MLYQSGPGLNAFRCPRSRRLVRELNKRLPEESQGMFQREVRDCIGWRASYTWAFRTSLKRDYAKNASISILFWTVEH